MKQTTQHHEMNVYGLETFKNPSLRYNLNRKVKLDHTTFYMTSQ